MFEKFAKAPKGAQKKSVKVLPETYVAFATALLAHGVRMSYGANSALLGHIGFISAEAAKVTNGGSRFLDQLPLSVQPVVCRVSGQYSEKALGKWAHAVEDLATVSKLPILGESTIVEAWEEFLASQEAKAE